MNRLLQNRLVLQLLFTLVAAVSVAALSVVLITEAVRSAERVVVAEAGKLVGSAVSELKQQYQYRTGSDSGWSGLPSAARDVSLRGISQTVLRSYPGVEGGFYAGSDFLGYAFPTHDTGADKLDVPSAERGLIVALVRKSQLAHSRVEQLVRGRTDLLVLAAAPSQNGSAVIWSMKRLAGRAASNGQRQLLLAILVIAALVSIIGTLATGLSLARGVAEIKSGLAALERDFTFRLPERSDEFGGINRSINAMASVRGKLEEELRREDRLRALGRLTASLAHEIRNPLNSIRLTAQLLERRLDSNSIRREDLRTVQTEVDRLNSLLNDLLDLQRSRHPNPVVQPVSPVLQHCIGLLERQAEMHRVRVQFDGRLDDLPARFDAQQLTQAVVNLLLNALEISPEGGTVRVCASPGNDTARIQIEDEGPGLSPEQQDRLFEPFYTTKPQGTGLGLAVSRELMRSQGGDLYYKSGSRGACFVITLPRN